MTEYFYDELIQMAESGDSEMQHLLGFCHFEGIGMKQDLQKAISWFETAAIQNHPESCFWLGYCFYEGYGILKDFTKALRYFKVSAENGDHQGQYYLGRCHLKGEGTEKNPVKALKWFRLATNQGNAEAAWMLAICYRWGIGTDKNDYEYHKFSDLSSLLIGDINRSYPDERGKSVVETTDLVDSDIEEETDPIKELKHMWKRAEIEAHEMFYDIENGKRKEELGRGRGRERLSFPVTFDLMNLILDDDYVDWPLK